MKKNYYCCGRSLLLSTGSAGRPETEKERDEPSGRPRRPRTVVVAAAGPRPPTCHAPRNLQLNRRLRCRCMRAA